MASQQRSIVAILRAEIGQYKAAMGEAAAAGEKVKSSAEGLGKSSEEAGKKGARSAAEMKQQWSTVATPLLAVGGAITAVGAASLKTGVQYNQLQQRVRAGLTTMLGSTSAVNAQMEQFNTFASKSPFSRETFLTAQQQMLAFGIETQKVIPYLEAVQDAVAAAGGGNQDIAELTFIMAQISAAGKISAQDLMQFGQRGVNAAELIGSQMGKTGAQIRDDITAGTLDANAALDALAGGMSDRFGGAADNVKNTFDGAIDRVKAAWRDLSSALAEPFVGSEGGGIFTALANEVADLMRTFQGLPGPVQAAGAVIAALVGATSLAAGGFLVMAPRIWETKKALDEMGISGSRGAVILGNAAKAAGVLAVAFATVQAASKVFTQDEIASGVETWTSALLGAAEGSATSVRELEKLATVKAPSFLGVTYTDDVNGLADAIGKLDAGKWERFLSMGGPGASDLESAAVVIGKVDESLASLVQSGNVDEAARLFDYVAEQGRKSGKGISFVKDQLPQYADALAGVANEQKLAAEAATEVGDANERAAERFGMSVEEYAKFAEEMNGVASKFFDLSQGINDADISLDQWVKGLEEQHQALLDFESNAIAAAQRGLDDGVIRRFREMGPEAAMRLGQLVDGSQAEIDRLNAVFGEGTAAAEGYASAMLTIPDHIYTEFGLLNGDEAFERAKEIVDQYNFIDDREITTFMKRVGFETDDIERMLNYLHELNQTEAIATARVVGDNAGVDTVNALLDGLSFLDGFEARPEVDLNPDPTKGTLESLFVELGVLDETITSPEVVVDPRPALGPMDLVGERLGVLDGSSARPSVSLSAPGVLATLSQITNMMRGLAFMGPVSLALDVAARVSASQANAIGGFYEGGVRAFASGGIDERGRTVPRQPQMRSGSQGAVVWGEAETGWEAYVSGKPGMRDRNRAVLGEAASRLGGDVTWYANGGFNEAVSTTEYARLRIRVRDLERDLRATGDDRLRGLDRTLAQRELRDAKAALARARSANLRTPKGFTADTWNDARSAAHDFRDRRMDEAALVSPASFERHMNTMLAESAAFTQALADLKKKGASPWLLEQLVAFGPSKSSIRTARALAKDTARLKRMNAIAGQLDQVSGAYGRMTSDPRFLQASAAGQLWSANQQRAVANAAAQVTVQQTVQPQPGMSEEQVAQMSVSKIMQALR